MNFRRWGEVTQNRDWENKTVTLHTIAAKDSLGVDLFTHLVLRNPQLKSSLTYYLDLNSLVTRLRVDETSLGLLPLLPAMPAGYRLLLISRRENDVAFGPTPVNIQTGDYPLSLPFYLAFKPKRAAELRPVLQLLLGDEVAAGLEQGSFVAVPAEARQQTLTELGR